jgi:hypothetical protein
MQMITTIETNELRELSTAELEAIQGAFWANAAGALVGAVSGGVSTYMAGGNWKSIAASAIGNGVAGAINPISSVRTAAMALGRSVISGTVAGAVNGMTGNTQQAAMPAQ